MISVWVDTTRLLFSKVFIVTLSVYIVTKCYNGITPSLKCTGYFFLSYKKLPLLVLHLVNNKYYNSFHK